MAAKSSKKRKLGKPGRKKIIVDVDKVRKLARFMYTDRELAGKLGMDYRTFLRRKAENPKIREAIMEGKASGCSSIRAKQVQLALKGNVPMLKLCGQQYLDQAEKIRHANDPDNPMPPASTTTNLVFKTAAEAEAAFEAKLRE